MENKDQGAAAARTAARCPICEQEISNDPGDFGTRCIRKIMGAPSTAAMVCYRLGYERLLAIVEQYPCPHGRPSWRMCPHCLGINAPSRAKPPAGPSEAVSETIPEAPLQRGRETIPETNSAAQGEEK